ncbi:MAG TPA: hypothetical protein VH415_06545 [Nitrososphaeraceae archaeon]|jgi:hypothetical protein
MPGDIRLHLYQFVPIVIFAFGFLTLLIIYQPAKSDTLNSSTFSVDSNPYGLGLGNWTTKWWQWMLSIPKSSSPADDSTGKNCDQSQSNPNAWFLAGTFGGNVERTCTIPSGKAILFPILNSECSYAEYPDKKTESDLRLCAIKGVQDAHVSASIDGKDLQSLEKYKIQSPLFNVTFPRLNIYGVKEGPSESVSDGYWVFLRPLSKGDHQIHFSGIVVENPTTGSQSFATEVTYHLKVV